MQGHTFTNDALKVSHNEPAEFSNVKELHDIKLPVVPIHC